MDHIEILKMFGGEWPKLDVYNVHGVPHCLGCEVVGLLGLSSTTQAIKGTPQKPKLRFPAYRFEMVPEVNSERSVYLLTIEGIIQVIKLNRSPQCKVLQAVLAENRM